MKLIYTILFLLLTVICYSQNVKDYSIYVGKVAGVTKNEFISALDGRAIRRDSALELSNLTDSKNLIEIRLYEIPAAMAVQTCTILYFDSSFHVKRVTKVFHDWEKKYNAQARNSVENIKADSAFYEIVKNGIFSLPKYDTYDGEGTILTTRGFVKNVALCGVTDGLDYLIQIKLQDVYKTINFSSREAVQLKCYPDNDVIRRKKNIVEQLEANIRFVKK